MRPNGFSIIECVVTITLISVVLLFILPLSRDFFTKNQIARQTQMMVTALHYAHHHALLLGKVLTLAPYAQGWSEGMVLFVDHNSNRQYDASEPLLFQWKWDEKTFKISWEGLYDYLLFSPIGMNDTLGGTFEICPLNAAHVDSQRIIMNRLGRIRVEVGSEICHT